MTLVQLQALVAIVEAGGFTEAAAVLGTTQSAVSHALAALEQELGVALLERGRKGTRLTAVGERVLAHARVAVAEAEAARQAAAEACGLGSGRLRVGSFPSVSARILPGVLRAFRARYPRVVVAIFEGTDDEVRDWIEERVVDIGLVSAPHHALALTPLLDDPFVAVTAPDDPLARQAAVSPADLVGEPFILSKAGCEPLIRHYFTRAGHSLSPAYAVRDVPTILAMVREGLGVTIVPRLALPAPLDGLLALPLDPPLVRSLALAAAADVPAAPAAQAFTAEALAWLRTQPALCLSRR
jgi:DNA-binding transcriptional LysR family regulator